MQSMVDVKSKVKRMHSRRQSTVVNKLMISNITINLKLKLMKMKI